MHFAGLEDLGQVEALLEMIHVKNQQVEDIVKPGDKETEKRAPVRAKKPAIIYYAEQAKRRLTHLKRTLVTKANGGSEGTDEAEMEDQSEQKAEQTGDKPEEEGKEEVEQDKDSGIVPLPAKEPTP